MFSQRKYLRTLAAYMLLVWVFALSAGIVNACVVEPELRHASAAAAHEPAAPAHQHGHAVGATEHQHQAPNADQPPCAKFCADESVSAPIFKQQSDVPSTVWLAPPPTVSLAARAALEQTGVSDIQPALDRARIPIPIAFLRLTL